MSVGREIKKKIATVGKTKKITEAMKLVAVSKLGKAQTRSSQSKPYATKMLQVIGHIANSHSEYHHRYLTQNTDFKHVGFLVVSSDRGLCGGLNSNVFKTTVMAMREWSKKDVKIDVCTIGKKAEQFFARHGGNVIGHANHLGDAPTVSDLIGVVKVMLDSFDEEKIDALFVVSNEYINTMTQRPNVRQLLPLSDIDDNSKDRYWDYIYEPDAKELMDDLMIRYIETEVYQAVIENFTCEQAARMVAMDSATKNAEELIDELRLVYNKARQTSITQELSEIVGGAAAIE